MKGLTDIPGIRVGHVSDFERDHRMHRDPVRAGRRRRRGYPRVAPAARRRSTRSSPGHVTDQVHGILLAGGSAFGLEAASGVRRYLEHKGVGFPTGAGVVPWSWARFSTIWASANGHPADARDGRGRRGRRQRRCCDGRRVGAGTGATVGKLLGMKNAMKSGIGSFTVSCRAACWCRRWWR